LPPLTPEPAPANLTADEEVTLRRVAFGQSEVRAMRAADLALLRKRRLIEDAKDGPCLTATGRKHFETLSKPSTQHGTHSFDDMLVQMDKMLSAAKR
jgi:hypothetical protein